MVASHGDLQGSSQPSGSTPPERTPQSIYREATKEFEIASDRLKQSKSIRFVYWLVFTCGLILVSLLAYSVFIGLWRDQPTITRYVGLLALLVLCISVGWLLIKNRREIVQLDLNVRNLAHDKQTAAVRIDVDSLESLRLYREASQDVVRHFRSKAARNLRFHNFIQAVIIVGSISASTTTALLADKHPLGWLSTVLTALVSITAGLAAYFKFRERGYNLQSTSDEIEKNYTAAQFCLDEYERDSDNELVRLRRFAKNVERLREDQRKRELQLEQSPGQREERA